MRRKRMLGSSFSLKQKFARFPSSVKTNICIYKNALIVQTNPFRELSLPFINRERTLGGYFLFTGETKTQARNKDSTKSKALLSLSL